MKKLGAALLALSVSATLAELSETLPPALNHPAIDYFSKPVNDPVSRLNRNLKDGKAQLKFEGPAGYLRSVLQALNVPVESQIAVFSKTSLQADLISPEKFRLTPLSLMHP